MATQGRNVEMTIESGYNYTPVAERFLNPWNDYVNDLEFRLQGASDLSSLKTDFNMIAKRLEETAKDFVRSNGTVKTGKLLNSIRAEIQGNSISLGVPGVHYAGHIEWGFTGRDGMPHGPWPYLRPAIHLVAADSTGQLAEALCAQILGQSGTATFGRHTMTGVSGSSRDFMKTLHGASEHNQGSWTKAANGIRGRNWMGARSFNRHGEL